MLYRGDHDRVLPRRVIGLIGNGFFNALFLKHAAGVPRTIENVILGPIVAVLSFVCSVGNVPLAAVLWSGGSPSSSGMGGHRHHRGWAVPVSSGMGGPRIIGDGRSPSPMPGKLRARILAPASRRISRRPVIKTIFLHG
jgi:hypothetical protein